MLSEFRIVVLLAGKGINLARDRRPVSNGPTEDEETWALDLGLAQIVWSDPD
jgi:hypothetical protein